MIGALGFASPAILGALLALPLIWWLLKLTPPKPEQEVFPPLRILAKLAKREETPAKSPWWLTLLRMALAAAIVFAMAGPVLNPRQDRLAASGPLLLVIDNSWATANDWAERVRAAEDLIGQAESAGLPVSLVLTAETRQDPTPRAAEAARVLLTAAKPKPVPPQRGPLKDLLRAAFDKAAPGTVAYVSDGMSLSDKDDMLASLQALKPAELRLLTGRNEAAFAITQVRNTAEGMEVTAARLDAAPPASLPLQAYDGKGRSIASGEIRFEPGAREGRGVITAPLELRNDFARISLGSLANAGTVHLLDEGARRRRVGILGGDGADAEQPLLSPVYYLRRALAPFADIAEPRTPDIAAAIRDVLATKPSVIVMADIGKVPPGPSQALQDWIAGGGTLIRFAGPQLAAAAGGDPFATVPLRQGERSFGGVLSWSEPQMLAAFPADGPFAGLPRPDDVHVRRQVLAEPSPDLAEHTLASLEDGTPLVTRRTTGAGQIVLFHVSAETSWSDLPLSGHFVDMLRQLVQQARSSVRQARTDGTLDPLPPYRLLTADGALTTPSGPAQPLNPVRDMDKPADPAHPPGLYGSEDGFAAHNLLPAGTTLVPLTVPRDLAVIRATITGPQPVNLVPGLLVAALAMALLDGLAVLWLNGALSVRRSAVAVLAPLALALGLFTAPGHPLADDAKPGDDVLLQRLNTTHLAYVLTGEDTVDEISKQGLYGLTQFLTFRTALEPGEPTGVDIAKDELSAFPLIYWPLSATAPMPEQATINRIGAYMRSGGTVLFDTRDQADRAFGDAQDTPNGERLKEILGSLDIPPLEPVPSGHVLTRSFFLLNQFPGRYAESPLWVEAGQGTNKTSDAAPVSADGVTPIMITANDFAGAWAMDDIGNPTLPTVPPDENQREYAFRAGVNIMMYMLTGNYKGDQVHVPALLERLGN